MPHLLFDLLGEVGDVRGYPGLVHHGLRDLSQGGHVGPISQTHDDLLSQLAESRLPEPLDVVDRVHHYLLGLVEHDLGAEVKVKLEEPVDIAFVIVVSIELRRSFFL